MIEDKLPNPVWRCPARVMMQCGCIKKVLYLPNLNAQIFYLLKKYNPRQLDHEIDPSAVFPVADDIGLKEKTTVSETHSGEDHDKSQ